MNEISLITSAIQKAVNAVCPNTGMSFPKINDKATWLVRFTPEATQEQKDAAQAAIDAFDIATAQQGLPADEKEADCLAALNGGSGRIDLQKLIKAKAISDEAYRLGKSPGQLTAQELNALRSRIANIYKAL